MPFPKKMSEMTANEIDDRKKEIRIRAKKVYDISFDYHLTHAVFGSDELLLLDRKTGEKSRISTDYKNALFDAVEKKDGALIKQLVENRDDINKQLKTKKYSIEVQYVPMDDVAGGRVLVFDKSKLIIELPEKIKKDVLTDDKLQKVSVDKIRWKMAHELGHIVLHTDFIPEDGLIGTSDMDDWDWEAEAFAAELLRLYRKRDHHILESDTKEEK